MKTHRAGLLLGLAAVLGTAPPPLRAQAEPFAFAGAGGGSYAVPVRSLLAARFRTTVQQQHDFSCGSAAVATLLTHHYGLPTTERFAFDRMYAQGDTAKIRAEGFSLLDIKRFLEADGFRADGFEVTLEQIEQAAVPAIVLIVESGYRHFVVLKGIRDGRVLLGDPSRGTRLMSRARFESVWQERLAFVIHGEPGAGGFNRVADWKLAPLAPLAASVQRDGPAGVVIPRMGPGDF